jgi:long-chain acyl-CoA synthetase
MKIKPKIWTVPIIASIQDMVIQSAARYSGKTALEDLSNTPVQLLSYSELLLTIQKFGAALRVLDLPERSHIAVIGENRVQWAVTYLACACFNYVVVPIDRNLSPNEVLTVLHESDSVAVVFSESYEQMLREMGQSLKKLKRFISMDLMAPKEDILSMAQLIADTQPCPVENFPHINPNEMSAVIFTSGTLGRAKGVMLSQGNIAANLSSMLSMFMMYPEDRFLSVLPMHHTYECNCGMLCPLYAGSSIHYARSLKTVVDDLQKVKATILLGVPLLYDKMFKRITKAIVENKTTSKIIGPLVTVTNVADLFGWKSAKKKIFREIHKKFGGNIRSFIAGGAAPDPAVARGLREFGFMFIQGYGLTETSPILTLNQPENFRDDAAGLPLPGVDLKINRPDPDGIGEVFAKGPNIMLGYYKNPEATSQTFENGWFKTGDFGYFDAYGFLHICGRKKNVIISKSGKNVFPEEIEDRLNRSPYILESLVYGEKDPKQDEIVAAQIVVDTEAFIAMAEEKNIQVTPELIQRVISDEVQKANNDISSYKQIRKHYIRDQEFQKTTTQKIKRNQNPPA